MEQLPAKMLMGVHWSWNCYFVIELFHSEHFIVFFILAGLSFVLAATSVAMPAIKRKILKKEGDPTTQEGKDGRIFFQIAYYLIYSTLHVVVMLLLMTYNGGVILFVIAGLIGGYFMFGVEDHDSDLPINCCAKAN